MIGLPWSQLKSRGRSKRQGIILSLMHNRWAYWADLIIYGFVVAAFIIVLLIDGPKGIDIPLSSWIVCGLVGWTLTEYVVHRFLLHGVRPFSRWHAEHHAQPLALIGTPTVISALIISVLVFLPAFLLGNIWVACAFTLGFVIGYQSYGLVHHAIHHWRGQGDWQSRRRRWHLDHHHRGANGPGRFGVTTVFWDYLFQSARPKGRSPGSNHAEDMGREDIVGAVSDGPQNSASVNMPVAYHYR